MIGKDNDFIIKYHSFICRLLLYLQKNIIHEKTYIITVICNIFIDC